MSIKISIFSLFRDSSDSIDRFFNQMDSVENSTDAQFEYFFYENDSRDNTVEKISQWMEGKSGKFLSESANEKSHGSTLEPDRMIKMARIRNKMANLGKPVNSDYSVVIDSDLIFDKNIINDYLQFKHLDFSMLTPNIRQTVPCKMGSSSKTSYYDSLSLFDLEWNHCMTWSDNPFYEDEDRDFFYKQNPIEVNRSFGGFVFIKSEFFNKVEWNSSGNLEHWALCDQLRSHGKIYFLPSIQPKVEIEAQKWEHENAVIEKQKLLLSNRWNRFLLKNGSNQLVS